jgi:hypothetical protein
MSDLSPARGQQRTSLQQFLITAGATIIGMHMMARRPMPF